MAQERPATPEKQLLKLIENRKAIGANVQAQTAKHRSLSFLSALAWKGRIDFFLKGLRSWSKGGHLREIDIKVINNILAVSIFITAGYFVMNLSSSIMIFGKVPDIKVKESHDEGYVSGRSEGAMGLRTPLSEYLGQMSGRDIFKMGAKAEIPPEQLYTPPTSKITEMTQNLRLVGISWSSDPDAMIEDTALMKTFFVRRGQMIGQVKVRAIFKEKVVLSFENEERELK